MRKIFLILVLSIFLTGCGSNTNNTSGSTTQIPGRHTFRIGTYLWEIQLSDGWKKLDVPRAQEAVFLAQRDSENLVILRRESIPGSDPSQAIWDEAETAFPYFKPVEFETGNWSFQAKRDIASPYRYVQQRILPIPESRFFLLASCSYEVASTAASQCNEIMNSWKMK